RRQRRGRAAAGGHAGRRAATAPSGAGPGQLRAPDRGVRRCPGARAERYLAPARRLGDAAVARLWARGLARSSEDAVALALAEEPPRGESPALTVVQAYEVATGPPSSLTRREQQIAAMIAAGPSN